MIIRQSARCERFAAPDRCTFAATWFVSSSLLCAEKRRDASKRTSRSSVFVKPIAPIVSWRRVRIKLEMCVFRFSLEFTQTVRTRRLVARLSQALSGRFLGFAPISYMAPQNRSKSDPNYQKMAETLDQKGAMDAPMTWLSTRSGMPFVRGREGRTDEPFAHRVSFLLNMRDHLNRVTPA